MLHIPISRWGEPYKSLEVDKVVHFVTGEVLAEVSRANGGLVERDMRHAQRARDVLREIPIRDLLQMVKKAGELYAKAELPLGDGTQTPDQFVRMQSATTGLPEHMCRFNMEKNKFVLDNMDKILDSLTRGLDLDILSRGYGVEARGVPVSYQAQSPVLGHGAAEQLARRAHALAADHPAAGRPRAQARPAGAVDAVPHGAARSSRPACRSRRSRSIPASATSARPCCNSCPRSLIFGGTATVEQYKGNPRVQAHGPGFSKIILGDDEVDNWEKYLDIMVDSVFVNSGRGCINCSGVWVSRHGRKIAEAIAEQHRAGRAAAAGGPEVGAGGVHRARPGRRRLGRRSTTTCKEAGVHDMTAKYGPRLVKKERCDYLRPTVIYCESPDKAIAKKEYMFPFVTVVECPQEQMLDEDRPDAGLLGDHRGREVPAGPDRRDAHRPAEHRPDPDDRAELAAAARGEHRRLPVPGAGVPVRCEDDRDLRGRLLPAESPRRKQG